MTVQEAEVLLELDPSVDKIARVSETTSYFIFNVIPVEIKNNFDRPLIPPIAVEKKTGETLRFNPMTISKDELKSLKRIR